MPEDADSGAVFPPIELIDDDDELEEVFELNGIPSPGDAGAELDVVRPPGRFKAKAGWPPALVLDPWPELTVELLVGGTPPIALAGCPGLVVVGDETLPGGIEPAVPLVATPPAAPAGCPGAGCDKRVPAGGVESTSLSLPASPVPGPLSPTVAPVRGGDPEVPAPETTDPGGVSVVGPVPVP